MENGSLMKVKSIAECYTIYLHLAIIGIENQFLVINLSGCLRQFNRMQQVPKYL